MVKAQTYHNVVLSSDDEERKPSGLAKHGSHGSKSESKSSAPRKSTKTAVKKRKPASAGSEKNNTTLNSFFAANSSIRQSSTFRSPEHDILELDDSIEDDYVKGGKPAEQLRRTEGATARKKRSWSAANGDASDLPQRPRQSGHRFLPVNSPPPASDPPDQKANNTVTTSPWNESYAPRDLTELAVHHKKVADVRTWLEGVFSGRVYQRLLVLKGTAGCGKTATISLLCEALGVALLEWRSPDLTDANSMGTPSATSDLADFLSRAGQYQHLKVISSSAAPFEQETINHGSKRRCILLEELPNMTGSSSTPLHSFRTTLLQYLASTAPRTATDASPTPLIILVSESVLAGDTPSENVTAHRLLGRDVLHHPAASVIEFNPVAPTLITKALKLVLQKHTRSTGRAQPVSPIVLHHLGGLGDLRCAVATLEYVCKDLDTIVTAQLPSRAKKSKLKTGASRRQLDKNDNDTDSTASNAALALISMRESTLGLFHAVGKVVYNKRDDAVTAQDEAATTAGSVRPDSTLNPDLLLSSAGTDTSTFLSALHENYLLSCIPSSTTPDADTILGHVQGCLEALGDADILETSASVEFGIGRKNPAFSQGVRQDEIALNVGVKGLQYALPYPVKRIAVDENPGANKRYRPDVHRMFYPTDIKLWRAREEVKVTFDQLLAEARRGTLIVDRASLSQHLPRQGGVKDFSEQSVSQPGRVLREAQAQPRSLSHATKPTGNDVGTSMVNQVSRLGGLLQDLPYYLLILEALTQHNASLSNTNRRLEVEKVVRIHGTGVRADDERNEDEPSGLSRQLSKASNTPRHPAFSNRGFSTLKTCEEDVEKLVLSDDDIIDD
ncbi:MAG: hypothetical protein Q9162_006447 [Coniocarpon cinnabarinum]